MIQVSQLTKRFGSVLAVDRISFNVPPKTIVGFLGANGAGKTTTMRMLAGLLTPTSGTATIGGFDCLADSLAVRRILGYMPEQVALYDEMRVEELLDYTAAMHGINGRDRKPAVAADLKAVLKEGGKYRIVSAQDFYGEAVAAGTYDGKPVELPMKPTPPVRPIGMPEVKMPVTQPEFGVFVVLGAD